MLTELTIIAASRCVSDDRGDLWQLRKMGISFGDRVKGSKKVEGVLETKKVREETWGLLKLEEKLVKVGRVHRRWCWRSRRIDQRREGSFEAREALSKVMKGYRRSNWYRCHQFLWKMRKYVLRDSVVSSTVVKFKGGMCRGGAIIIWVISCSCFLDFQSMS
jgi:hypothetical protein